MKAEFDASSYTIVLRQKAGCNVLRLWEGNLMSSYLLSNDIGVMAGFDFESTVVRPKIN